MLSSYLLWAQFSEYLFLVLIEISDYQQLTSKGTRGYNHLFFFVPVFAANTQYFCLIAVLVCCCCCCCFSENFFTWNSFPEQWSALIVMCRYSMIVNFFYDNNPPADVDSDSFEVDILRWLHRNFLSQMLTFSYTI